MFLILAIFEHWPDHQGFSVYVVKGIHANIIPIPEDMILSSKQQLIQLIGSDHNSPIAQCIWIYLAIKQ